VSGPDANSCIDRLPLASTPTELDQSGGRCRVTATPRRGSLGAADCGVAAGRLEPAGRVYTAKDIVEDPHYQAREMVLKQLTRDGCEIDVPGIVPKLLGTPGRVRSSAPKLGDDTDAVLGEIGFSGNDIAALRGRKVVA